MNFIKNLWWFHIKHSILINTVYFFAGETVAYSLLPEQNYEACMWAWDFQAACNPPDVGLSETKGKIKWKRTKEYWS